MRPTKIYPIILILAVILGINCVARAGELINPRLGATYVKLTDGTKSISLSMSARIDDKRVNIEDLSLQIYAVNESGKILVGNVVTDHNGKAVLNINPDKFIPKDHEGYFTFDIQYPGNPKFNKTSATIHVKDASLAISFSEKDSTKNVIVKVSGYNETGGKVALANVPVEFYIKRLFCLYRFDSEKSDSSGSCTAEFPKNMPGDTTGKVIVVAKILENDTYGTVEAVRNFAGGKPLIIEQRQRRGLGDTDAPLWMVYTLLVLLTGVWFHVLYVIGLVIRINILGKKSKLTNAK